MKDKVVNPSESGTILAVEGISELSEIRENNFDSEEFIGVLKK